MKTKTVLTAVFLASGAFFTVPSNSAASGGAGASAVLTLLEPLSAALDGMAGAGVSLHGSPYLIRYNPAGLFPIRETQMTLLYRKGIADDYYAAVAAARQYDGFSAGMALQYYNSGEVTMYDHEFNPVTKTGQRDVILNLAAAGVFGGIPAGVNLKLISSEIFGFAAAGVAADIGAQYRLLENFDFGLAVRNLGPGIKYVNRKENLPLNIAAGVTYTPELKQGLLSASLEIPYHVNEKYLFSLIGLEYVHAGTLLLRAGYRLNMMNPAGENVSLTLGAGVRWEDFSIDYSVGLGRYLDSPHNISLNVSF